MHSAHYTQSGDIVLDSNVEVTTTPAEITLPVRLSRTVQGTPKKAEGWTTIQEKEKTVPEQVSTRANTVRESSSVIRETGKEGIRQYSITAEEAIAELKQIRDGMRSVPSRIRGALRRLWKKGQQDVRMPAAVRTYTKADTGFKRFAVDTIRFGGTFAAIFGVLFVAMNYQSFYQIAKAELALGGDMQTEQGLERIVSGNREIDMQFASADLLSYLPNVGPYEDRLIIPKLGENVPIVKPSMDALMKEDWKQFEDDIQTALRDGVVHYPGSARPGQAGNFFLTGHSSYYPWDDGKYKDVFARLGKLEVGDTYSVYYGGDRHTYRITGKREVKPTDTSVLDQPVNKRIATLMTCTPIGTTIRRLIVSAEEIDPSTGDVLAVGETARDDVPKTVRLESLPI